MNARSLLGGLALAGLLIATSAHAAGGVLAQRGGIVITMDDVRQLLASLDPARREKIQRDPAALATLVRERLVQLVLLQEAHDRKWDQRPEIAIAAAQAHDAVVVSTYLAQASAPEPGYPAPSDIQAAYDANAARLMVPRQYQLAQIFIAIPAGSARAAEDDAKRKADDLRTQAAKPRADFAALAVQNVAAEKGGNLGWMREDQMAPEIRMAVAGLPEGGVSDPVRMADGWHVMKLLATKPAAPTPLADIKDKLADALRTQRTQQNAQAYVAAALRAQPAQIDEIALGKLAAK